MNDDDFDFGMYDQEDTTPRPEPVKESKPKESKKSESKEKAIDFDFDMYDEGAYANKAPEEESAKKDVTYQSYLPQEKNAVELSKMSIPERQQYAKDINTSTEYLKSKGLTKGTLSGATLGASEYIDALKPEPHELGVGTGELIGAALPITGAAKAVGYGLKGAMKYAPPVIGRFMQAFGTGALYETGKQGVKGVAGDEVDLSAIPKEGLYFAALDKAFHYAGKGAKKLYEKFKEIPYADQIKILEERVIPEGLSKSEFETSEEMLDFYKKNPELIDQAIEQSSKETFPGVPSAEPSIKGKPTPLNQRNISHGTTEHIKEIGLRPSNPKVEPDLQDKVGNIFSDNTFYNTTNAGKSIKKEIINIDEDVYRGVNDMYKISKELNKGIEEIHPQLISKIQERVSELKKIPEPSTIQKRLITASDKILDSLAVFENIKDEAGNVVDRVITGYKTPSNQTLIDQIQSLRQIIDYDFSHGDAKNIFKPLIGEIQDSVQRAAKASGNQEAAEAITEARSAYKTWAETFDNDYVRPFRDASNHDYSKLYKSSLDFDEHNVLRKILNLSEDGTLLADASTRDIVEKNLSKFFKNPREHTQREFNTAIKELGAIMNPNQQELIKKEFAEASKRINVRARKIEKPIKEPPPPTPEEIRAAKYEKSTPEDIQRMMNSRSGIRELRKDFSDSPKKRQLFEKLKLQRMRSIMRGGEIDSGTSLYKFLNKEHNAELFYEFIGEEATEEMRLLAKEIGEKQLKQELRKESLKASAKRLAGYKALELVFHLI